LLLSFEKRGRFLLVAAMFLTGAAPDDQVVAIRGNEQITLSEAHAMIAGADQATQQRVAKDPAALKTFLRDVLVQRAILQEAAAAKWAERADVAALLQRARDQIVVQTFLAAQAPLPAGYPTDADIQAAYDANRPRFLQPRSYHLAQIFLPLSVAPTPDEGRRRLLPARQLALRGKSLEAAAKSVSGAQVLDTGWAPETQIVPAVKAAVAGLPEGGLTDPICTENGCHLIRLIATRPAGPAPLADVKADIIQALRRQKQAEEENAYASRLLEKQPIAINEIQLSHLTTGAAKN
jgi:peptidylprolyl isomerase